MYIRRISALLLAHLLLVNVVRSALNCSYLPILTVDDKVFNDLYGKIERQGPAVRWSTHLTVDDNAYPKLCGKIERHDPTERWLVSPHLR